jgi:hypothetical protein
MRVSVSDNGRRSVFAKFLGVHPKAFTGNLAAVARK